MVSKISDLKIGQGSVDIEAEVKSVEEPRIFNKFGRELKVMNAVISDDSGEIKLTLWNEDIDKVKVGSKVKITKGFVNEFNGEKQLTAGKFGKLEILGAEKEEAEEEKKEQDAETEDTEDEDY
jgi:replication factor A1